MNWTVFDHLLKNILKGTFQPGELLPSENEIVRQFQVPRLSVRRACETLEHLGYLTSQQGVGRRVRPSRAPLVLSLVREESFSDKMARSGKKIETRIVASRLVKARPKVQKILGLRGKSVFKLARLRILGKTPVAIHISYLDPEKFPSLEEKGREVTSLFAYFRSEGFDQFEKKRARLSITFPTSREHEILDCPALVPLVMIESETLDARNQFVLQYTKILYRSDLFVYEF